MKPEQKAVVLDAAQEMQHNDTWWEMFEYKSGPEHSWLTCDATRNPLTWSHTPAIFRRKPRTITVTIPVPAGIYDLQHPLDILLTLGHTEEKKKVLAAIREAMKDE